MGQYQTAVPSALTRGTEGRILVNTDSTRGVVRKLSVQSVPGVWVCTRDRDTDGAGGEIGRRKWEFYIRLSTFQSV